MCDSPTLCNDAELSDSDRMQAACCSLHRAAAKATTYRMLHHITLYYITLHMLHHEACSSCSDVDCTHTVDSLSTHQADVHHGLCQLVFPCWLCCWLQRKQRLTTVCGLADSVCVHHTGTHFQSYLFGVICYKSHYPENGDHR